MTEEFAWPAAAWISRSETPSTPFIAISRSAVTMSSSRVASPAEWRRRGRVFSASVDVTLRIVAAHDGSRRER